MKRPDFIIGGSTRSGANTLLHILGNHPQIFIPHLKAHRFFLQDGLTKDLITSCRQDFLEAARITPLTQKFRKNAVLFGEKQYDLELAAQACPNAKIIFTLRDPAERANRLFHWARASKRERVRRFDKAVEEELMGKRAPDNSDLCWLYKNQYETHIKKWVSHFPRKNMLFLVYEEWTDPKGDGLKPLENFLGLKQDSLVEQYNETFNAKEWINVLRDRKPPKYKPLSPRLKTQLEDIFAPDKAYISTLLNRDVPLWDIQ